MASTNRRRTPPMTLDFDARDHLWMHFARMGSFQDRDVPVITRGEGSYIYDSRGRRILDGLSALFVVQVGHGRRELAEVAAAQAAELAYFPVWGYATPPALELAERLATYTPGDLDRVFFTTGGGEAVESAWKVAKQHFKLVGKPLKHKVISRATAYHGTTHGALAITGVPAMKQAFEPLAPGGFRAANTNFYRAEAHSDDRDAHALWAADRVEEAILFEGPETVAAVVVEPVQNSGGCLTAPASYFRRLREICDKYDVLLVSDEVICAFGRHGTMFACTKFGYTPDIITCAKGMSSGYGPIGAMIASERVVEPFLADTTTSFTHGYTFGGHPVSAAVSLANLDIFEREKLNQHVLDNEDRFEKTLGKLLDLPVVGDVRGDGYFWAVELVTDKATKGRLDAAQRERVVKQFLPSALFDAGLYCRPDDRGDAVIQVAPPLTCGQAEFDEMEQILRDVLIRTEQLL
ncbi:aspartate aminotransferase family protein [Rhodococcus sp. BP-252]|uniref:aspartate aminotransferase family protein n=1 Tax=unclassified Rhodococcus (in: high G+C Gram-positive bacteria) TaxID=192944 RepID=UPI001C9AE1FE|nr:aspartate aminotransferase family protein [Rhodococcus sp. BP-320]MBY6416302.1 aspartate aminotransferase family protein [Rhodococcus sp. BP-321]MBY6420297.1 aspartate aminotransferase family protein [Rhodococcus sp. BP-324]MBY6424976.1 aspartate aminotransferase family protein [Rhodococcus sp. BP-323]MBY6430318.1 aspartate aminotransferase family protein [Rhodococcus sp. BP-322]MBY6439193.1 aspartate aminotransferase family protein [Rhodococcus sp. BP-319]MBY6444155.1 aspartate aminotrans